MKKKVIFSLFKVQNKYQINKLIIKKFIINKKQKLQEKLNKTQFKQSNKIVFNKLMKKVMKKNKLKQKKSRV